MASVNQFNLVGNAGKDAETTTTSNGNKVTRFSIAVSEYAGKNADGTSQYTTQWFNIICWNGLADIAAKLVKRGNAYFVSGRLVVRKFEGKHGKDVSVEVIANTVTPMGKPEKSTNGTSTASPTPVPSTPYDDDDADPFMDI